MFSELYATTNDAAFIYAQGRCLEENRRYEEAIARFKDYLRVGKRLSSARKADAQKHLSDCQDLLGKQPGAPVAPAAQPRIGNDRESRERSAMKACLTGDVATGMALLTDLFIDTRDTTYLFNQGRCFEQNRRYEEAIGRFREYLIKTPAMLPEYKADTEKHIAACESYLQGKTPETTKVDPVRSTDEPSGVVQPSAKEEIVARPVPPRAGHGAGLRVTGVVVAALGAAGVATGLILNLKANGMAGDLESLYDADVDSRRKRYETAAWVGYGTGAACLVGGAVLYYLGRRQGAGTGSVALVPTVAPDAAGAILRGRF
jgi:tetratricopeptide (TPR) repeat protein